MGMPTYLLLLLTFTLTQGQSTSADEVFDLGLIETTHHPCPPTHDCIVQEKCRHFQEDVAKLENISIESLEYESLVAELRKGVCNKEEKGFCCSSIETNSVAGPRATKCCRQCRYNPRQKKCVSRRPGNRCCPCSPGCKS